MDQARFPTRKFKGMLLMAEAHGQRGHGYFVPLKESKDFIKPYNCPNLPDCEDKAECQESCLGLGNNVGPARQ